MFTGRFAQGTCEVLFDRIFRENGIQHLLTAARPPTTTGKVERWHKTLRSEFLTGKVFTDLADAQAQLDGCTADTIAMLIAVAVAVDTARTRWQRTACAVGSATSSRCDVPVPGTSPCHGGVARAKLGKRS